MILILMIMLLSTVLIISSKVKDKTKGTSLNPYPEDFNFSLAFNPYGRTKIDTYNSKFTIDLMDRTKTIDFSLPLEIKKDIYNKMIEMQIMNFPEEIEELGSTLPSSDYKLIITFNGATKHINWHDGPGLIVLELSKNPKYTKDNVEFLKLVKFISEYIYSTEEYQRLPKPNGGYD